MNIYDLGIETIIDKLNQDIAYAKKYAETPLNQIPNRILGRPLTEDEMECLRLIGSCKFDNPEYYKNWLRSIVVLGNIPEFVKDCKKAKYYGYYLKAQTICNEAVFGKRVPFPPQQLFERDSR